MKLLHITLIRPKQFYSKFFLTVGKVVTAALWIVLPDQVKTYSFSSLETRISNIMNLSHHNLTIVEIYVSSNGLTLAPTHKFNHFEFISDASAFTLSICLKFYYSQHHQPVNQPLPRTFLYLNLNLLRIF